jgi:hypothetical protein
MTVIDATSEVIGSLKQAAEEWVPRRRRGRKCHVSTLYRWATAGCRGVRLEVLACGHTLCTSREALQMFFEELTKRRGLGQPAVPVTSHGVRRSATRRQRDSERAARQLESMGARRRETPASPPRVDRTRHRLTR